MPVSTRSSTLAICRPASTHGSPGFRLGRRWWSENRVSDTIAAADATPPSARSARVALAGHADGRLIACLLASLCSPVLAEGDADVTTLDEVVVTARRSRESAFDAPASINAVTRQTIENAGPQINLSESLSRVPGIVVLNRNNYAQDQQLSIRGFGARSTFGIRGVRLIVDGIPATMPDGQGQASSIDLGSAGRIEVLRGPLAQLYGNAAGGVVQVFTQDDALRPTTTSTAAVGPYGLWRVADKFSTTTPSYGLTLDASWFQTDGRREQSAAERGLFNGRLQGDLTPDLHASLIVNVLDQPVALDPGGLTRAMWQADPGQTAIGNIVQNARKTVRQAQIGNVDEWRVDDRTDVVGRLYVGQRDLFNALSTPFAPQQSPTSSGGIVQFSRLYAGFGLAVSRETRFDDGRALRVTAGIEGDWMRENRQGYVDDAGQQGALKRDERNTVDNLDLFVQAAWEVAPSWTLTGGARHSNVRFRSQDHFVTAGNPDDSGGVDYGATSPVAGIAWRPRADLNVYANVGRGFETPTFTELAYRPNGTGLNTQLNASRSRHAEIGAKWRPGAKARIEAALFDIRTDDELVVDTNVGGRSTYLNAGRTTRRGVEFSYVGQWTGSLRATLSATLLQAVFKDSFKTGSGSPIASGNTLPGTPERYAFAELVWQPAGGWGGFNTGIEVVHSSRLWVDDANRDYAPAATVVALRAGFAQHIGVWRLEQRVRLDNALNRNYVGSVIVNESNKRYFEPALPRNWLLAMTVSRAID